MSTSNEVEVVISGMSGLFPKCSNIDEFKKSLLKNESLIGARWKNGERGVPNSIGVTDKLECCDNFNLGINSLQCRYMDPMHRLILERAFEALIDAGINPNEIRGRNVAVFTGAAIGERDTLIYEQVISGLGVTGHARGMMSNRISYWLDLHGSSTVYQGSWLSGFLALQAAFEAVRDGFCEAALVGTSNLALNSEISWMFNDMGLLSPDGTTRSFDDKANGYARSDGVVMLYIQRAADARRSYATILGVDSTFDGNRDGPLLSFDKDHMATFLNEFYSKAHVDPLDVDFVECNGNGCKDSEEKEISALEDVFGKNRKNPLLIGSVKSNAGHSEASAIMFSIVKVIIAMETGIIPANINFETPNRSISALNNGSMKVVSSNTEWNSELAAINGIGLSSSYGHILLRRNSKIRSDCNIKIPILTTLSTRTDKGINDALRLLKLNHTVDIEYHTLIRAAFRQTIDGHLYRGYAVLNSLGHPEVASQYYAGYKRQVWFIYSGMGSQWCKMGADLMALPLINSEIQKCHKILEPKGVDLFKILTSDDPNIFDDILNCFVGIAAIQVALTSLLRTVGIVPDGMIGHSVGELGCAYADGCFTHEQAMLSAYARGQASTQAKLIPGMMAAVGMGHKEMESRCPHTIEVACHNSSTSCTISGPVDDMTTFVKELQNENVFARLVNVANIAYHSRYIKPAAPLLLKYLREIIPEPRPRSSKWVSSSIPEIFWDSDLAKTSSAEYHTNNLLSYVLFEEAVQHVPKNSILIEIAPHGLLQAILKRSLDPSCINIPLTNKSAQNGLNYTMSALGRAYLSGIDLNLSPIYPTVEYPVSRGTSSLCRLVHWEHSEKQFLAEKSVLVYTGCDRNIAISLMDETYNYLYGHFVRDSVVFPITSYLIWLFDIQVSNSLSTKDNIVFENLEFREIVTLTPYDSVMVSIRKQRGSGYFEASSGDKFIASGCVNFIDQDYDFTLPDRYTTKTDSLELTEDDIYEEFVHRGHHYGGVFKSIKSINVTSRGLVGTIQWNNNWEILLEGMLQLYVFYNFEASQATGLVSSIRKIVIGVPHLQKLPADIQVFYDLATNTLKCDAIHIYGTKATPYMAESNPSSLDVMQFSPLSGSDFDNIELGLNLSIQLVLDSDCQNGDTNNILISEIETDGEVLQEKIINVTTKYPTLNAHVTKITDSDVFLGFTAKPLLVIVNSKPSEYHMKLLTSTLCFMLAHTDCSAMKMYPEIVQVAQFFCQQKSYSLLKKCTGVPRFVLNIDSRSLRCQDLVTEEKHWAKDLKKAVLKQIGHCIYFVTTTVPKDGIYNFVRNMRSWRNMQNLRFLFILDGTAPSFSENDAFYKEVFERDLVLTVIKYGCIGTLVWVPSRYQRELQTTSCTILKTKTPVQLKYMGVNMKNENQTKNYSMDYSGLNERNHRIMGLAKFDMESVDFIPDSILHWCVPDNWTLEHAATVPYAYSFAYYALVCKGNIRPGKTVLINSPCSAIRMAAINIAYSTGCIVYTTVFSNAQRIVLQNNLGFLKTEQILGAEDTTFEPLFLQRTFGYGADVVLNGVTGSIFAAILRCVADFGRIIEIGDSHNMLDVEVGMKLFSRNVSISHINSNAVLSAPRVVKSKIHQFVSKSLAECIVRPLQTNMLELRGGDGISSILSKIESTGRMDKTLIKLSGTSQLYSEGNVKQQCDPSHTFLIYGNKCHMWIDLIECLTFRGARKFVTFCTITPENSSICRRLHLLQHYHNITTSNTTINPHESYNIKQFIRQNFIADSIGGLFVLPSIGTITEDAITFLEELELAMELVAPKAYLVNMLRDCAGIYDSRMSLGFRTYNIQWNSTLPFYEVLDALDDILNTKSSNIVVKTYKDGHIVEESSQSLYDKLRLLLPSSKDDLIKEIELLSVQLDFVGVASLCTKEVRESPPTFIIPGMLKSSDVPKLARKLMYNVYMVQYGYNNKTLQEMAETLVIKIRTLCPKGPYNVIGLSMGGVLAIEIVRILQQYNFKTQLFLIDGAPDTIQNVITNIGEGTLMDAGFLGRVFNITDIETTTTLKDSITWESKLKAALDAQSDYLEDRKKLTVILDTFNQHLREVLAYKPGVDVITGKVWLLRPKGADKYDTCGLKKFCKYHAEIVVGESDFSLYEDTTTTHTINEMMLC